MSKMVVCAWCGKLVRSKGGAPEDQNTPLISHTICAHCKAKVIESFKRPPK